MFMFDRFGARPTRLQSCSQMEHRLLYSAHPTRSNTRTGFSTFTGSLCCCCFAFFFYPLQCTHPNHTDYKSNPIGLLLPRPHSSIVAVAERVRGMRRSDGGGTPPSSLEGMSIQRLPTRDSGRGDLISPSLEGMSIQRLPTRDSGHGSLPGGAGFLPNSHYGSFGRVDSSGVGASVGDEYYGALRTGRVAAPASLGSSFGGSGSGSLSPLASPLRVHGPSSSFPPRPSAATPLDCLSATPPAPPPDISPPHLAGGLGGSPGSGLGGPPPYEGAPLQRRDSLSGLGSDGLGGSPTFFAPFRRANSDGGPAPLRPTPATSSLLAGSLGGGGGGLQGPTGVRGALGGSLASPVGTSSPVISPARRGPGPGGGPTLGGGSGGGSGGGGPRGSCGGRSHSSGSSGGGGWALSGSGSLDDDDGGMFRLSASPEDRDAAHTAAAGLAGLAGGAVGERGGRARGALSSDLAAGHGGVGSVRSITPSLGDSGVFELSLDEADFQVRGSQRTWTLVVTAASDSWRLMFLCPTVDMGVFHGGAPT